MKKEILFFTDNSEIGTPNVPVKNKQFKDGGVENGDYQKVELELSNNSKSNYVPAVKIKALFDYNNEKIKFVGLDTFDNFRMRWIKVQENKSGYFIRAKYFGGVVYIDNYLKILSEYKKQTNPKMAEGGLIAPNGERSFLTPEQYRLVRTPEFKAWFGDWENDPENASKVVYHNGEPMPVYHGTTEEFTTFEEKSYFTDDYMNADGYANGEIVIEAFLIIKNPLIINAKGRKWDDLKSKYGGSTREIVDNLDHEKYDGVIFNSVNDNWFDDEGDPQNVYNVNFPTQIKLADGTNTTFDGDNPDIRYKDGGKIENLISKGDIDLKFYETTSEHAKELGIKANNPIYIQNLNIPVNKRLQGIGKDVLEHIETQARKNGNDVIFGYVAQKATFTKDKTISYFSDVEMIKNWLHSKGYAINEHDNIFHKVLNSSLTSNSDDIRFKDGGSIDNERIVCQKCDWSWKVVDGGDDLYVCHKCGYDNAPYYATKFAGGGGIDINEPFNVNGKTLAERVRILVKQLYPDYKWSITSSYSKMDVYLLEADFDPFTDLFQQENPDRKYYSVDDRDLSDYNRQNNAKITERAVEVFKPIREYINKFVENYNANDPYADYSNYNVYEYTYIGKWDKPYKQVEPKSSKKAKAKATVTPAVATATPSPTTLTPRADYPFEMGDILAPSKEKLDGLSLGLAAELSQYYYEVAEMITSTQQYFIEYTDTNESRTVTVEVIDILKGFVKATVPLFKMGDTVVKNGFPNNPLKIVHRSYYQQTGVKYSTLEKRFLLSGMYWNYALEDATYANEDELEFYNATSNTIQTPYPTQPNSASTIIENIEVYNFGLGYKNWNETQKALKTLSETFGEGWRLPTVNECASIIKPNKDKISYLQIDENLKKAFWTSSEGFEDEYIKVFDFEVGTSGSGYKPTDYFNTIAVRDINKQTTATQEKGLPSTDPQTWNGEFKVGDKVKIRWDFSNDLGLPDTKGNAKVDYFSNENNFTIVRIDKRFQEPEATGGIQRAENPTGLLYVLSNKQSWEGKDLELVDGASNSTSATPTTQPQYNFLDYLIANSEKANKFGKDLEISSSFAMFVNAANQIENMPKQEYAELMSELLDKFPKTTN